MKSPQRFAWSSGSIEAEALEDTADARLDAIPVELFEAFEEFALAFDEGVEVAKAHLDLVRDPFEFELDVAGLGECEPELFNEPVLFLQACFLAEVAERAAAKASFALFDRVVTREDAQDGGLAAAVRANKARALTISNDKGETLEHVAWAE